MSEPIYSGPNPSVQNPDVIEPEQLPGDQIPPDPLLETGWFIDSVAGTGPQLNREPETKKPAADPDIKATTAPEAADAIEATPVSQWRPRRQVDEMAEQPDWLPEGWKIEVRVRVSGATAGTADRYFIAPSGQKFRSKVEVLHFLETGSRRKRKLKSDADATPSDNSSDNRKKKSKSNIRNFSDIKFDFRNPPPCLTWVQADDCPDDWVPISGNATVPESRKTEWGTVFSRVTQLDRSNGVS